MKYHSKKYSLINLFIPTKLVKFENSIEISPTMILKNNFYKLCGIIVSFIQINSI